MGEKEKRGTEEEEMVKRWRRRRREWMDSDGIKTSKQLLMVQHAQIPIFPLFEHFVCPFLLMMAGKRGIKARGGGGCAFWLVGCSVLFFVLVV